MCRRPSRTNKYGAMADFPPTSSKKTCKNLPPLKKTLGLLQQKLPLGRTKGFPTAPPPPPIPRMPALSVPLPGDGHGPEAGVSLRDGFLDGGALGAHPQAVAGILHVAPCGEDPGTRSATPNPAGFPPGNISF